MRKRAIVLVLALLVVGIAAASDIMYDSNKVLGTAPAAALANPLSSADASVLDTPIRPRLTFNCAKVVISPSGSVQGATACLKVCLYQRAAGKVDTFATIAFVQTITFDNIQAETLGGRYVSRVGYVYAPTLGCQIYDVRLENVSSGNVTWSAWPLGSDTAPSSNANE